MRERWRFSALEHFVPDGRTDGQSDSLSSLKETKSKTCIFSKARSRSSVIQTSQVSPGSWGPSSHPQRGFLRSWPVLPVHQCPRTQDIREGQPQQQQGGLTLTKGLHIQGQGIYMIMTFDIVTHSSCFSWSGIMDTPDMENTILTTTMARLPTLLPRFWIMLKIMRIDESLKSCPSLMSNCPGYQNKGYEPQNRLD